MKSPESAGIDVLDRQILRACQLHPRGSFRGFAAVLGVSEQTVARRYRRLAREGVLRIVAVINPAALGESNWVVRVQCRPNGATSLGRALAQRDDVSWVALSAGGSEITCAVRSRTAQARDELLMQRLPQTSPVLGISAAVMLHSFVGGAADDWAGLADVLSPAQVRQLGPSRSDAIATPAASDAGGLRLTPEDEAMLAVLTRDGRAAYSALAAAARISEGRAARRLDELLTARAAYLDVDLSAPALGFTAQANLWLTVTPAELDGAGRTLSRFTEVAFAAAISGPQNLTASVMCRNLDHLYRFVTTGVGTIPGVTALEVSPVLRNVKQAGTLVDGDRLAARG